MSRNISLLKGYRLNINMRLEHENGIIFNLLNQTEGIIGENTYRALAISQDCAKTINK